MGRRGTKNTPTELQKLRGTYREDRHGGSVEVPAHRPPPPSWLDAREKKYWRKIAKWLDQYGLLTQLDQVALGLLVTALCDFVIAREIIDNESEKGENVRFCSVTDKGNVIQHPAVGVMNKAHARVLKLLQEFGMTPSSRAGLKLNTGGKQENPLDEFGVVG